MLLIGVITVLSVLHVNEFSLNPRPPVADYLLIDLQKKFSKAVRHFYLIKLAQPFTPPQMKQIDGRLKFYSHVSTNSQVQNQKGEKFGVVLQKKKLLFVLGS